MRTENLYLIWNLNPFLLHKYKLDIMDKNPSKTAMTINCTLRGARQAN